MLCSHMGAEARSTGGNPAAILAAVREFSISCDMTDGDGALVDFYFPLALISCPANCTSAPSRGVVGRQGEPPRVAAGRSGRPAVCRSQHGKRTYTVVTPNGCPNKADAISPSQPVWPIPVPLLPCSSPYECASSVCQAAIHAGVITNAGGKFWLNHEEGQPAYLGRPHYCMLDLIGVHSSTGVNCHSRPCPACTGAAAQPCALRWHGMPSIASTLECPLPSQAPLRTAWHR